MSEYRSWLIAQIEEHREHFTVAAFKRALAEYDRFVEQAPVVFGDPDEIAGYGFSGLRHESDTHTARLVEITPIKKEYDEK